MKLMSSGELMHNEDAFIFNPGKNKDEFFKCLGQLFMDR